jgi:hypothetical protein
MRQGRIDVSFWPDAVVRDKSERTTASGGSRRFALPRKLLLEFTLSFANSRLPREDHRLPNVNLRLFL